MSLLFLALDSEFISVLSKCKGSVFRRRVEWFERKFGSLYENCAKIVSSRVLIYEEEVSL